VAEPGQSLWDPSSIPEDELQEKAQRALDESDLISSEADALYQEFKELSKKNPESKVSDLSVEAVNHLIRDAKQLLGGDRYVDRMSEFVPAGENPSNSDVVLVLSKLRAALKRFTETWDPVWEEVLG